MFYLIPDNLNRILCDQNDATQNWNLCDPLTSFLNALISAWKKEPPLRFTFKAMTA
jgi:hypothetical protein